MSVDQLDELIERMNDGDVTAAERAFLSYEPYLRMAVRRQLSGPLRSKLDSMDIVQSVWADVLVGFRAAGWRFTDRFHLRAFLLKVVRNRLIDRRRQHHRALEQEQALSRTASEDLPQAHEPSPSAIVQENELWSRLCEQCPPAHREILVLKRQGLRLAEIAARTGLHEGSIRRILYDLARRMAVPRRTASRTPVQAGRSAGTDNSLPSD
jgi:RNA polymerase sigma-70 factor (ECF subfamily)